MMDLKQQINLAERVELVKKLEEEYNKALLDLAKHHTELSIYVNVIDHLLDELHFTNIEIKTKILKRIL